MQKVSVVIPNFNGMAYLDGVLSSLERQTIDNFEVILVDNGSTDGSCAFVAAEYPWVHMISSRRTMVSAGQLMRESMQQGLHMCCF